MSDDSPQKSPSAAAPDLMDGFMLNGIGGTNQWSTEIQSVLRETSGDAARPETRDVYLSHECRMERLPFSTGALGSGENIFQHEKPWEFVVYAAGDETRQLSTGDVTLAPDLGAGGVPEMMLPSYVDLTGKADSKAFCPERSIQPMSLDDALSRLRNNALKLRETFLHVSWRGGNAQYELFCPCRYINFPPSEQQENHYIQPISGYVLYPFDQNTHMLSYVACAMNAEGKRIIEFCCKRYLSIPGWMKMYGEDVKVKADALASLPVLVSQFDGMIKVEGDFNIYTYI